MGMLKMFLRYGEISVIVNTTDVVSTVNDYRKQGIEITGYLFERI